jgi:site-specific DNA-cytosine methylase
MGEGVLEWRGDMGGMAAARPIGLFCGIGGIRPGMGRAGSERVFPCGADEGWRKAYAANLDTGAPAKKRCDAFCDLFFCAC